MGKPNPVQIQKFLSGVDYPVDKEALIRHARDQGADDEVIGALERMPGTNYETPADVSEALGQIE